jgi:hypothetical protein
MRWTVMQVVKYREDADSQKIAYPDPTGAEDVISAVPNGF